MSKAPEKKKRRRNRGRKRRGLPALTSVKQMDLKEQNAEMRAKLADRLSRDKGKSGGAVEDRLARLAGCRNTDPENNGNSDDEESDAQCDAHSDGYDSESGEEGGESTKITGKMRSDDVEVDIREKSVKNKEKWKHDKFDDTQNAKKTANKFGKHWNTRRERIKERSRSRSKRRSRSNGYRSSRSRSQSRGEKKKKRRRGKFSKSRSRSFSTSESSKSRSKSQRHRSRSSRSSGSRSRRGASLSSNKKSGVKDFMTSDKVDVENNAENEGINLELSGALAADSNTVSGTVVKYSEPTEARKPKKKWRLYVFKVFL